NRDAKTAVNIRRVEGFDLKKNKRHQFFSVPDSTTEYRYPTALAFDAKGERLPVGTRATPRNQPKGKEFFKEIGGYVFLYKVVTGERLKTELNIRYRTEAIAFRPKSPNQVATAGGNDHEVRLWDVTKPKEPLDTIRGPGSCLWAVAM